MSLALAAPAFADPPGRIGRVAYLARADGLYVANVASGDILTTDNTSRTKIQIGSLTVRLDRNTSLELARVDDDQVALSPLDGRQHRQIAGAGAQLTGRAQRLRPTTAANHPGWRATLAAGRHSAVGDSRPL